MGSNKDLERILGTFQANAQVVKTTISLEDKLRRHAEAIRKVQGIASNAILTQGNIALFMQFLADSYQTPIQYQDVLQTNFDIKHDMLLRFEAGSCAVVSALFPTPLVVTEALTDATAGLHSFEVKEFFNIMAVIRIFGGQKVSFSKNKVESKV